MPQAAAKLTATIYLASGCFWGREFHLSKLPGVISTRTGFMGGTTINPTYQQVCENNTGHTETVEVIYDTRVLTTRALLTEFFTLHDFTVDRTESDGQYRSVIFLSPYEDQAGEQREMAAVLRKKLIENGYRPATAIISGSNFYPADNRHQKYCLSKGMVPKKRSAGEIREILTL